MKRGWGAATAAIALAFIAAAWYGTRDEPAEGAAPEAKAPPAASAAPKAAETSRVSAPAAVLAIKPRAPQVAGAQERPTLKQEYFGAKQLKPLYDRLRNSAEGTTAEGAYTLYDIARQCAHITDRPTWRSPNASKTPAQQRDEFLNALTPNDPQHDKRMAAFERYAATRCDGFEDVQLTQADLKAMLATAANAGSAQARALQVEQEVQANNRGRWNGGTLTDAQIDSLKQIIASKDPGGMLEAGRILSNTYADLTLRQGDNGPVLEPRALHNAWALVACEYGYPCGSENPRLQYACAYQGHCDASNVQDYLYYYGASPHDSQLMNQYESLLRHAVETGDWSQIAIVRGAKPPNSPGFIMGHGPGPG
jgi:hypothetical protein